jgi:RNA polymerase sigma-70 factor, ECF subfamily
VEGRPLSEATLVANARKGDLAAYAELVRMHQDTAFRVAYLITGSAADAEEAAQDGFLKAHAALDRFDERRPFRPWLLRIVANDARNRRRARGRRDKVFLRLVEGSSGGAAQPPDDPFSIAESRSDLLRAVARLRVEEQLVVIAKFFAGLTDEELSLALDVPVGTVKSRLSRALARLRVDLELSA